MSQFDFTQSNSFPRKNLSNAARVFTRITFGTPVACAASVLAAFTVLLSPAIDKNRFFCHLFCFGEWPYFALYSLEKWYSSQKPKCDASQRRVTSGSLWMSSCAFSSLLCIW